MRTPGALASPPPVVAVLPAKSIILPTAFAGSGGGQEGSQGTCSLAGWQSGGSGNGAVGADKGPAALPLDPHSELRAPSLLAKPGPELRGGVGWSYPRGAAKGGRHGWTKNSPHPPRLAWREARRRVSVIGLSCVKCLLSGKLGLIHLFMCSGAFPTPWQTGRRPGSLLSPLGAECYDTEVSAVGVGSRGSWMMTKSPRHLWAGLCCLDSLLKSQTLPSPGKDALPCSSAVAGDCPIVGDQMRSH